MLTPTRPEDPPQKVGFMDNKWFSVDAVYLAVAVRNVGIGIAVLHGWFLHTELLRGEAGHAPLEDFRRLTRDVYIAPGDTSSASGRSVTSP